MRHFQHFSRKTLIDSLGAYCWWGRNATFAPYYGAYAASAALANADYVKQLDDGASDYAAYAFYNGGVARKILLYNSVLYQSGSRGSQTFTVEDLSGSGSLKAKRLTAPNAYSTVTGGEPPSFGGQQFSNDSCTIRGDEVFETVTFAEGVLTAVLADSEVLLVYL